MDHVGHDAAEGFPSMVASSRWAIGARRVAADFRASSRGPAWPSCARYPGFALAAVLTLGTFNGIVQAGDPPPVVVDSIEPTELVQGQVPSQPEIQVFGSNFIEGLPNENNRPTVTLRHVDGLAEFSVLAFVNIFGTVATVPALTWNFLQAPLGVYDVIVTRPTDNASDTLKGAFTITEDELEPGEIALVVRSAWGGPVNGVAIAGDLAYAAIGRRLVILDVADPMNPVEVGSLNLMAGVVGVAVSGDYAFLAALNPYGFNVVDVSDPTNPTLVLVSGGDFSHVVLYGDLAYMRSRLSSLDVFDITDPLNVVSLGQLLTNVARIAIGGDLLYVGTSSQCCQADLKIYDLTSDPLNPVLLGSLNIGTRTTGLAIAGNYAYWTGRHEGDPDWSSLTVVDVSNPQSPTVVASKSNFVWTRDVDVGGGYAYVADATGTGVGTSSKWALTQGLVVFDIADPANPTVVTTFKTHGDVQRVDVVGDRAYLHDAGEGLIILDVSDPTNPVRLGNYHSPADLRQMAKVGDLLYIADAWNGFTVLDVADTAHPEVVGVYLADHYNDLGVNALGIDIRDNLVYLGAGHLGLEVVDASDPASPIRVGEFRIPPPAVPECGARFAGVKVWGDDPLYASIGFVEDACAWVASVFLNLDVSDPANIVEVGRVNTGGDHASKIVLNDQGIAFIARHSWGQLTVDTSDSAAPFVIPPNPGDLPDVTSVALEGNTLYVTSDENLLEGVSGLYIQDVTDPANLVDLTHVSEDDPLGDGIVLNDAFAVAVQNQRVYVAGRGTFPGGGGISVVYLFDGSDPTLPELLDAVPYAGGTKSSVFVDEPDVFAANGSGGNPGLVLLELVGLNPVGDLDGDGSVGASDLLILLASWGPCPPEGECTADLNDDGGVGAADLLILLANWG